MPPLAPIASCETWRSTTARSSPGPLPNIGRQTPADTGARLRARAAEGPKAVKGRSTAAAAIPDGGPEPGDEIPSPARYRPAILLRARERQPAILGALGISGLDGAREPLDMSGPPSHASLLAGLEPHDVGTFLSADRLRNTAETLRRRNRK